jgi:hypothetical protein
VRIRRPLVIAALAASLVAVGGTAASASTNSPQYFRHGQEHFVLWTRSTSSTPTYRAVAFGVFNGAGAFRTISATSSRSVLIAHIAGGSFLVTAQDNGTSNSTANKYTCRETYTSAGNTYQIKDGTGRLWGLFGWGTYSVYSVQTAPRYWPGGPCDFNAPPVPGTTFTVVRAAGPVYLPGYHYY